MKIRPFEGPFPSNPTSILVSRRHRPPIWIVIAPLSLILFPRFIIQLTQSLPLQHKRYIAELREKDPDVIFLGDCVLESLAFTDMWRECFAPLHCLNLSIRQDKVQNLLWRVQNGILENVKPKVSRSPCSFDQ